jgi:hypothetical protein
VPLTDDEATAMNSCATADDKLSLWSQLQPTAKLFAQTSANTAQTSAVQPTTKLTTHRRAATSLASAKSADDKAVAARHLPFGRQQS